MTDRPGAATLTGRPPGSWRSAATGALLVWAGVRAVLALLSFAVVRWNSGTGVSDRAGAPRPDNGGSGFFAVLHHWDSNYLLAIARSGYFSPAQDPSVIGYFPGYPLLARAVAEVTTGGSPTATSIARSMFAISAAASLAAAIVLWRLVESRGPSGVAPLATTLMLAGPYGVFLAADYSEPLFLAFAVAAWYCAGRNRWWPAGGWCAAATFTRINGCFVVAGLVVMFVVERRRQRRPVLGPDSCWVLLAVSGTVAYFAFLAVRTGRPLAWLTAQKQGWGRGFHPPWSAFYQTAGRVLYASTPDRRLQFGMDLVFAAVVLLAVVTWIRRREWACATYAGTTLLAMTTSFTFVSLARNTVTLFPLAVLGAVAGSRRWQRGALVVVSTGLFLANAVLFSLGYWTD